jgi:CheY-like chemotaxis protein
MVHGFVEQSGGRIEVQSEQGQGTTFVIRLPRAEGPTEIAVSKTISDAPSAGTETVLLVEDEDNVRTMSKRLLQAQGYTVLDARDGADAVSLARCFEAPIDILVTDIVMPRMGGRDVAAVLVQERPEMRVLLMSGYSDPVVKVDERTAFLQKPFRPKDLARKVRAVLDGSP